jgi:hypothetical protein
MSEDGKKDPKRLLPTLLLAGAMAVPAMADPASVDELVIKASGQRSEVRVLDSQANWQKTGNVTAPQWAEVTWGEVTWAKGGFRPGPNP